MTSVPDDLVAIYREAVAECAPERLVLALLRSGAVELPPGPLEVVAIGKCAGGLYAGFAAAADIARAIVVVPRGYPQPEPKEGLTTMAGSHPQIDEASFAAGGAVREFVRTSRRPVVFLISGGASACVEWPLAPWFSRDDLALANHVVVASALPIGKINTVRRHLSAIKGGRLAAAAPDGSLTLIYSDVASGRIADVGSGPTLPDASTNADAARLLRQAGGGAVAAIAETLEEPALPETPKSLAHRAMLVADNGTLVARAALSAGTRGYRARRIEEQIEGEVATVAKELAARAGGLRSGEMVVAGGEPIVAVRGHGRGGRCCELAARFAIATRAEPAAEGVFALFAGSDGVDGNSGVAGFVVSTGRLEASSLKPADLERLLARSDSYPVAAAAGEAIMIPPTGNNLRDLFLLARG
jgi:glycerate 2-kinase